MATLERMTLANLLDHILSSPELPLLVLTRELEDRVLQQIGGERYHELGGYRAFANDILERISRGELRAVQRGVNGRSPSLSLKVRRVSEVEKLSQEDLRFLLSLHPLISTRFYHQHPQKLLDDRGALLKLSEYLRQHPNAPLVTLNERSFQIFGNEKFLASSEGRTLLKRVAIDLTLLQCSPTYEPFFYYDTGASADGLLIVENRDTFFSIHSHWIQGRTRVQEREYRILIYGEGKKIERSFDFINYVLPEGRQVDYFGDLDPEGIEIFLRLRDAYKDFSITPCYPLYEYLYRTNSDYARPMHLPHPRTRVEEFAMLFSPPYRERFAEMLGLGFGIPQEGIRRDMFGELFGG